MFPARPTAATRAWPAPCSPRTSTSIASTRTPSVDGMTSCAPLDAAVRQGHGELRAGSWKGGLRHPVAGMHPECRRHVVWGLLWLCNEAKSCSPVEQADGQRSIPPGSARRALASGAHAAAVVIRSDSLKQTGYPTMARTDEYGRVMYRHWLVDALVSSLMCDNPQGWMYAGQPADAGLVGGAHRPGGAALPRRGVQLPSYQEGCAPSRDARRCCALCGALWCARCCGAT